MMLSTSMPGSRHVLPVAFLFLLPALALAQPVTVFNSNGFEPPYNAGNIHNQQGWTAQGSPTAGFVGVSPTFPVYAGNQSFRINGPQLTPLGLGGSTSSFWVQLLAPNLATSFQPVAQLRPIVVVNWHQYLTGTTSDITTNMPFSGVHIEGYQANGVAQRTTEITIDMNDSVGVYFAGVVFPGAPIPGLRDSWINITAFLDFSTQSVNVYVNGSPYLVDIPFDNSGGTNTIGLAEADFFAVNGVLASGFQANNQSFFDNFSVTAIAPVPEPSTLALMAASFGMVGYWYSRRQRKLALENEQPVPAESVVADSIQMNQ